MVQLGLIFNNNTMQEIIDKFNSIMEEYNEAYTNAKDEKEQAEVNEKYEAIIKKGELSMEEEMEESIQAEAKALKEEQDKSENDLKALESEKDEIEESLVLYEEEELFEMKEKDLIEVALYYGLEAEKSDHKVDTYNKVIKFINDEFGKDYKYTKKGGFFSKTFDKFF